MTFAIKNAYDVTTPRSRPRLMKRQCSVKMRYEKTILDSLEL